MKACEATFPSHGLGQSQAVSDEVFYCVIWAQANATTSLSSFRFPQEDAHENTGVRRNSEEYGFMSVIVKDISREKGCNGLKNCM